MILKFTKPVEKISNLNAANVAGKSKDLLTYYIENFPGQIQYAKLKQCQKIPIELVGRLVTSIGGVSSPSEKLLTASVKFVRKEPEYAEINTLGKCPNASLYKGSPILQQRNYSGFHLVAMRRSQRS